jgi:hypothetical protein
MCRPASRIFYSVPVPCPSLATPGDRGERALRSRSGGGQDPQGPSVFGISQARSPAAVHLGARSARAAATSTARKDGACASLLLRRVRQLLRMTRRRAWFDEAFEPSPAPSSFAPETVPGWHPLVVDWPAVLPRDRQDRPRRRRIVRAAVVPPVSGRVGPCEISSHPPGRRTRPYLAVGAGPGWLMWWIIRRAGTTRRTTAASMKEPRLLGIVQVHLGSVPQSAPRGPVQRVWRCQSDSPPPRPPG